MSRCSPLFIEPPGLGLYLVFYVALIKQAAACSSDLSPFRPSSYRLLILFCVRLLLVFVCGCSSCATSCLSSASSDFLRLYSELFRVLFSSFVLHLGQFTFVSPVGLSRLIQENSHNASLSSTWQSLTCCSALLHSNSLCRPAKDLLSQPRTFLPIQGFFFVFFLELSGSFSFLLLCFALFSHHVSLCF